MLQNFRSIDVATKQLIAKLKYARIFFTAYGISKKITNAIARTGSSNKVVPATVLKKSNQAYLSF